MHSDSNAPSRYATSQLLQSIRRRGGRVTCRDVYRKGLSCRSAAEARDRLQWLVSARLGRWEFPPPSTRGGRPTRTFVLTPRRRADPRESGDDQLAMTLRFGMGNCPGRAALAADLVDVLMEHHAADPSLRAAEVYAVLSHLRAAVGLHSSRRHGPRRKPPVPPALKGMFTPANFDALRAEVRQRLK